MGGILSKLWANNPRSDDDSPQSPLFRKGSEDKIISTQVSPNQRRPDRVEKTSTESPRLKPVKEEMVNFKKQVEAHTPVNHNETTKPKLPPKTKAIETHPKSSPTVYKTTFEATIDALPEPEEEDLNLKDESNDQIDIETDLLIPEVEDAVVKIQAGIRGYLARKNVREIRRERSPCRSDVPEVNDGTIKNEDPIVPPPSNFSDKIKENGKVSPLENDGIICQQPANPKGQSSEVLVNVDECPIVQEIKSTKENVPEIQIESEKVQVESTEPVLSKSTEAITVEKKSSEVDIQLASGPESSPSEELPLIKSDWLDVLDGNPGELIDEEEEEGSLMEEVVKQPTKEVNNLPDLLDERENIMLAEERSIVSMESWDEDQLDGVDSDMINDEPQPELITDDFELEPISDPFDEQQHQEQKIKPTSDKKLESVQDLFDSSVTELTNKDSIERLTSTMNPVKTDQETKIERDSIIDLKNDLQEVLEKVDPLRAKDVPSLLMPDLLTQSALIAEHKDNEPIQNQELTLINLESPSTELITLNEVSNDSFMDPLQSNLIFPQPSTLIDNATRSIEKNKSDLIKSDEIKQQLESNLLKFESLIEGTKPKIESPKVKDQVLDFVSQELGLVNKELKQVEDELSLVAQQASINQEVEPKQIDQKIDKEIGGHLQRASSQEGRPKMQIIPEVKEEIVEAETFAKVDEDSNKEDDIEKDTLGLASHVVRASSPNPFGKKKRKGKKSKH